MGGILKMKDYHEELIYEYYSFLRQLIENTESMPLKNKLERWQQEKKRSAEEYVCKIEVMN